MARFIREHEFMARKGIIYVDEYATKWEVVAKEFCAEFPCAKSKYAKKECATAELAAQRLSNELKW